MNGFNMHKKKRGLSLPKTQRMLKCNVQFGLQDLFALILWQPQSAKASAASRQSTRLGITSLDDEN